MQITVTHQSITEAAGDMLVLGLFEDAATPAGALAAADAALNGIISQALTAGDVSGKLGETWWLPTGGLLPAPRLLLTGLGRQAELTSVRVFKAAAAAAKAARGLGIRRLISVAHGAGQGGLTPQQAAQAVAEGTLHGAYRFHTYKRDLNARDRTPLEALTIVETDQARLAALRTGAQIGAVTGAATNWARDLVNEPANYLTPRELARRVQAEAEAAGVAVQVLDEAAMAKLGAGSFLGIARGSDEEAQFIVLDYAPAGADELPTVALVGKGITFDTGGISIKPTENMWKMKDDMGGAAAVAAAVLAAARLQLPVHAVGLIPATENMPGGDAIKPSDVVTAINGKTMEVISTDAEGRQVLADALCYAARYNPDAVVDIATLTGSIGIALGLDMAGLFCDDADLQARLMAASERSGDLLWPMPLYKPYRRLINSEVADMKNSGGRYGGAIIGALFLQEFAGDQPWAHLDIAGPVLTDENTPFAVRGATGFGARLLLELLHGYAGER
ncbi:MAG: leucyl aminopeptidase [Caldilineales bacterium]